MAWKLKKEKPRTGTASDEPSDTENTMDSPPAPAAASGIPPVESAADELEPLTFREDDQPIALETPQFAHDTTEEPQFTEDSDERAPIVLDAETHSPFAPYQPSAPEAAATDDVAAGTGLGIESPAAHDREAVAPGLVTTDSESGLPKVAPFVIDTPPAAAGAEPEATHRLILRLGNLSATFPIVKDVTTIGRPDSTIQNYPDVEVELDDGVSRRHAEIRRYGDQCYLVDVGSTNGTILNGEMLQDNEPALLSHGDRIRIGERTEILFE